jgi:hypothetical protein
VPFILTFYKLGVLCGAMIFPDLESSLKMKAAVTSLGPEYSANIHQLAEAIDANQATVDKVNAWLVANGFDGLPADALKPK